MSNAIGIVEKIIMTIVILLGMFFFMGYFENRNNVELNSLREKCIEHGYAEIKNGEFHLKCNIEDVYKK